MAGHYPLIENDRPELVISGDQPLCPLLANSGHKEQVWDLHKMWIIYGQGSLRRRVCKSDSARQRRNL